jgi:hypothetical protein
MVRELIERHLANEYRQVAFDWLNERAAFYCAAKELGLAD